MDLLNPEGECFPIRASYIKTDLIPPNAGLHYSNIPVFQYPMAFICGKAYYL
jgi:hypothetical protein